MNLHVVLSLFIVGTISATSAQTDSNSAVLIERFKEEAVGSSGADKDSVRLELRDALILGKPYVHVFQYSYDVDGYPNKASLNFLSISEAACDLLAPEWYDAQLYLIQKNIDDGTEGYGESDRQFLCNFKTILRDKRSNTTIDRSECEQRTYGPCVEASEKPKPRPAAIVQPKRVKSIEQQDLKTFRVLARYESLGGDMPGRQKHVRCNGEPDTRIITFTVRSLDKEAAELYVNTEKKEQSLQCTCNSIWETFELDEIIRIE